MPAVRAAYGAGRLLAVTTSTLGWLLLLAALASPAAFVMGVMPAELSLAGFAALALALAGAGLLALLAAQVATALFDQADATRELVAFERAKWGGEQGQDA